MRYEKEILQYKSVIKDTLDSEEVSLLGQPAAPGLTLFKLFLFFMQRMAAWQRRIDELEGPTQALVNRMVDERVEQVTAELEKKWAQRIANVRSGRNI